MTTLSLAPEYLNVLQTLGNVEEILKDAVRAYAVEQIGQRIGKLQHEISAFRIEYGLSYERFYAGITTDEDFVKQLRQTHPLWERDFNAWQYYVEELQEWLGRLEIILTK